MTIKIGDPVPAIDLRRVGADGMEKVSTSALTKGQKVVLFAVPGAFTPTCSEQHLPGFIQHADAIKAKGVDRIICVSVNDAFVMSAWEKAVGVDGKIDVFADGNGEFAKALGLELDASGNGLGIRSKRYAMIIEDGVVKALFVEEVPTQAEASSANAILAVL
jgi:peroxiredoxin